MCNSGIWIYNFLNQDKKTWIVLYIALIIIWALFGLIFAGIQKFKNRNRKFVENISEESNGEEIELV